MPEVSEDVEGGLLSPLRLCLVRRPRHFYSGTSRFFVPAYGNQVGGVGELPLRYKGGKANRVRDASHDLVNFGTSRGLTEYKVQRSSDRSEVFNVNNYNKNLLFIVNNVGREGVANNEELLFNSSLGN